VSRENSRQVSVASTPVKDGATETPKSSQSPETWWLIAGGRGKIFKKPTAVGKKEEVSQETSTSEYLPSQLVYVPEDKPVPQLRKKTPKKRKSLLGGVVVAQPQPKKRRREESVQSGSAEESPTGVKTRKVAGQVIEDSQAESSGLLDNPIQQSWYFDEVGEELHTDLPTAFDERGFKSPSPELLSRRHEEVELKSPLLPLFPELAKSISRQPSEERQSRSRERTPPPSERHRSLTPITKVDTWFALEDPGEVEESQVIQVKSQDPSPMNPQHPPPTGPSFTPIQSIHRQAPFSSGTPALNQPPRSGQLRRSSSHSSGGRQSRRSGSGPSFSATYALRERFQAARDESAYENIRALASYARKTPSLMSSATANSVISTETSVSSLGNISGLKLVALGEKEYILSVPGTELQKRMTKGVLVNKQEEIRAFCNDSAGATEETVESMKILMQTCSDIATHPYAIITPPLANVELPEPKESEYLTVSSGKFIALGSILKSLHQDKEIRIGIVLRNVKAMDLVEGFLRGREIRVRRTDGESFRPQQNLPNARGPTITLVLGGPLGFRAIVVCPHSKQLT
jgi:Class II histone deacetylase complex subunits 2 and 3